MDKMTMEEFEKMCLVNNKNVVRHWDYDSFQLHCVKCGSNKCYAVNDMTFHEGRGGGCETCGWGADVSEINGSITIKCGGCGNAMTLITSGDIESN